MAIETELKFLVSTQSSEIRPVLRQLINDFTATVVNEHQAHLSNTYYDTEQQLLRKADIGLRTRSRRQITSQKQTPEQDETWEQTIKTAGKTVGGLHQRPEYNIPVSADSPDLTLFDRAILPDVAVHDLQAALIPLFNTGFDRHTWHMAKGSNEFEMVFDQGKISCGAQQSVISEIELELVKGSDEVLFLFARLLVDCLSKEEGCTIRMGSQSKAARGYRLFERRALQVHNLLGNVTLAEQQTLEQAFGETIEYGLQFMQHHEACFVDSPSLLALRRFTDGVALIRHGFWLFTMVVPPSASLHFRGELKWILQSFNWVENSRQLEALKSKTGMYSKKLNLNQSLSQLVDEEVDKEPDADSINAIFASARYNHFLLDLTQWLIDQGWRNESGFNLGEQAQGTLRLATSGFLQDSWQSLLQLMPKRDNLSIEDYMQHHQQLKRSLLTGACVASLYDAAERKDFRMPWIDLSQGIDELKTLHLLQSFASRVEDSDAIESINDWLEQQIESLLLAMEQSRKSAVKMRPYWA